MKKYFCSVYNEPEKRFNSTNNADGCWESTRLNLKKEAKIVDNRKYYF